MLVLRCWHDATPVRCGSRGGDTNNDPDLEDESQGWSLSVSVSPDPRAMAPLCVSVPVSEPLGQESESIVSGPGQSDG